MEDTSGLEQAARQQPPVEGPIVGDDGLSTLACFSCKRRKVKCNRTLPKCSLCQKIDAACEYPTHAEKPGPKAGTPQRNKRRRIGDGPPSVGQPDNREFAAHGAPTETGFAYDLMGGVRSVTYNPQTATYAPRPPVRRHSLPDVTDATIEQSANRGTGGPMFTQLTYPSHEERTRQQSPFSPEPESRHRQADKITVASVSEGLKISVEAYNWLMECYFANMTSFTLFKPGSIEKKLASMRSRAEAEALVASMFSFAARFDGGIDFGGRSDEIPMPGYFAHIASQQLDRALNERGDTTPPLWVLQACILVTFYQLTRSVRSRSWRALGSCIRLAYDMQLHIVDANHDEKKISEGRDINIRQWSYLEERRRAWWAIWEMDVYASTIRKLPTAIDWAQNLTLLPIHDNNWFSDTYQKSCFLVKDPELRWKSLANSGNDSPTAWFIVINALMRNTQLIVYPPGTAMQSQLGRTKKACQTELDIMSNCLYCTILSLPAELQYKGEILDFKTKGSSRDINPRQYHCSKYSIHLMMQLNRFMIYHHKICTQAPWITKTSNGDEESPGKIELSEWSSYVSAVDEIVSVVRNSSTDHYKYVNPFLVNTVWWAAAAECACKVFGPASFDRRVADSNLTLLRLTVDHFITFWGSADTLKAKLAKMEEGLRMLMDKGEPASASKTPTAAAAQSQSSPGLYNDASQTTYSPAAMTPASLGQQYVTPGTDAASSMYPSIDPALTGAEFLPNPYDFTQSMLMTDQNGLWAGAGASGYFPYGLEELLTYGTNGQVPPVNNTPVQ